MKLQAVQTKLLDLAPEAGTIDAGIQFEIVDRVFARQETILDEDYSLGNLLNAIAGEIDVILEQQAHNEAVFSTAQRREG